MHLTRAAKPWDEQGEAERADTVARARRRGKRLASHPAWSAMVDAVKAAGGLLGAGLGQSDFWVHDAVCVGRQRADRPFAWAFGPGRTFLAFENAREARASWFDDFPQIYTWDGVRLSPADADRAAAHLRGESREG